MNQIGSPGHVIRISGARTHNLQSVSVDIPTGQMTVVTGVSGSGKSSLAFDTLFAEGQRRYLESVSVHTRSLIRQMQRPDVNEILALPPTVSVDQKVRTVPARSTLAITTEIQDFLKLLYARAGLVHCTTCNRVVESQTPEQILAQVMQLPERTRCLILAPLVRSRRGAHKDVLERIARFGFVRARINGTMYDIANVPELSASKANTIEAVVDRLVIRDGAEARFRESIDLACREGEGSCIISSELNGSWNDQLFSTRFCCPDCDLSFPAPEPRLLSFTSGFGACSTCEGYGVQGVAEDLDDITVFRQAPCPACNGSRLQPLASGIEFLGFTLADFTALSVDVAVGQLQSWDDQGDIGDLPQSQRMVAERVLPDIRQRLQCLQQVGLGYLQLNRVTRTLSGGEFQRARLATCLGSSLTGACYVLDEPTTGLHPRDTSRLLQTLRGIRDNGSTLVVVEHDPEVMRAADWLIDVGPGAGSDGGRIVFAGPPAAISTECSSATARCLAGSSARLADATDDASTAARQSGDEQPAPANICIRNASLNCLQNLSVDIPLHRPVCVTGVSGSGKSSLIMETLLPVITAAVEGGRRVDVALKDVSCEQITQLDQIQRVAAVGRSAAMQNRRSCIATISGIWTMIRKLFANTREARAHGYKSSRFSFNSGDGRCSDCRGTGQRDVRMAFLPNAVVPCPTCRGQRFNAPTLEVRFKRHSAADVLEMRVEERFDLFSEFKSIHERLNVMVEAGLGYLTLGQPAATFSGGETQRIRLATELFTPDQEHTLFVLDEPTAGLHASDVSRLLLIIDKLIAAKHSVIVIEHNLDVIRASSWVIDIGPECGPLGGQLVFEGTPREMLAANGHTADALRASCSIGD